MKVVAVMYATANVFDVTVKAMCSRSRRKNILVARQVAMYVLHKHGNRNYTEIGRDFDGRTHATVIHGVKKIERLLSLFYERIEQIVRVASKPKGKAMKYNMQLGVELRCGKCQDRLSTDNIQAVCPCENITIQRLQDPFTKDLCALVEVVDANTVEAQRQDGKWVPLLETITTHSAKPPHIGQATEIMMRSAIEFWEYTRETHKKRAPSMGPINYWKECNTLILGLPRRSGSTTAALKLAAERGTFSYIAKDWTIAQRIEEVHGRAYVGKGVFTSPENMDEELRGLVPNTFVFDGVLKTPHEWNCMLTLCVECASARDFTEILILRIGEAL